MNMDKFTELYCTVESVNEDNYYVEKMSPATKQKIKKYAPMVGIGALVSAVVGLVAGLVITDNKRKENGYNKNPQLKSIRDEILKKEKEINKVTKELNEHASRLETMTLAYAIIAETSGAPTVTLTENSNGGLSITKVASDVGGISSAKSNTTEVMNKNYNSKEFVNATKKLSLIDAEVTKYNDLVTELHRIYKDLKKLLIQLNREVKKVKVDSPAVQAKIETSLAEIDKRYEETMREVSARNAVFSKIMKESTSDNDIKLEIYESCRYGEISEEERDLLLEMI
jgi:hypothetical protein